MNSAVACADPSVRTEIIKNQIRQRLSVVFRAQRKCLVRTPSTTERGGGRGRLHCAWRGRLIYLCPFSLFSAIVSSSSCFFLFCYLLLLFFFVSFGGVVTVAGAFMRLIFYACSFKSSRSSGFVSMRWHGAGGDHVARVTGPWVPCFGVLGARTYARLRTGPARLAYDQVHRDVTSL